MLLSPIEGSPAAAILAYCFSSMSMTLVNKYVVSGNEWNLNFFYLLVQVCNQLSGLALVCGVHRVSRLADPIFHFVFGEKAIVGTVAILVLKRLGLMANLRPYETKKARACRFRSTQSSHRSFMLADSSTPPGFPISLLLVGMIYTSIQALQFLSVPVYTIFKNLTIIAIAYGEALGLSGGNSGHGVTRLALLSFALMVLSSVVAAWDDIQSVVASAGDDAAKSDVTATTLTLNSGYFWMGLNILCAAAYALRNRRVMVTADLKSIDVMFYNNLLSIPILLVCSSLLEDWSASNVQRNFPTATRHHLAAGMVYSGLVAILISYCTPWCIRATSSTTYAMAGALNKLPVAVLGIVFFASPVTVAGAAAIFIGVLSGVVYTLAKTRETTPRGRPMMEPILPLQDTRQKV
ncbi:GDP-mannose transporter into the lumen of the Golgi [Apiospora marii]|uniref:GDP-mannose transporter into the lumen of the Golgi n=1 Tax=Apiospora marii TaxID=335849 RepID=UPI00312D0646